MTSPVPGFTYPNPRTWSAGDAITTPRLRGDMANLAFLFAGGARPLLVASLLAGDTVISGAPLQIAILLSALNTWNVPVTPSGYPSDPYYQIPFAGYWLLEGSVLQAPIAGGSPNQARYGTGLTITANGAGTVNFDGGVVPSDGNAGDLTGGGTLELIEFNTYAATGDNVAVNAFTSYASNTTTEGGTFMAEWVALPLGGLFDYAGSYGTVVASPVAAAPFPSGQGTTITNAGGIAAGATSMTVSDATGMITGGTLGLDFIAGRQQQVTSETVSITSVTGLTIGITATSYPHSLGAPVAVPVSAAFLNQQCRDVINFLAYPPLLRAVSTQAQSIATSAFPPTVAGNPTNQITHMATTLVSNGADNFTGFASNAYTVPVAGTYLVYAQIPYAGSTSATAYSTGISVNGGTILWGTIMRSDTTSGAQVFCPTFRRLMRFSQGDVVTLWAYQGSGSAMNTFVGAANFPKLIMLFRGF